MDITATKDEITESARDDEFWVMCSEDGVVSLCSSAAYDFGISFGETMAKSVIDDGDVLGFEDALMMGSAGGEVSVLLRAAPHTGYSVASVERAEMFSSFAVKVRLYKNKSEYLAISVGEDKKVGKVFDRMGVFAESIDSLLQDVMKDHNFSDSARDALLDISRKLEKLALDERFFGSRCLEEAFDAPAILDSSELFDIIKIGFSTNVTPPFSATFENAVHGKALMCCTDAKRFTGIVLTMAAVTAKLSRTKECNVTLSSNDDFVLIESSCSLNPIFPLYGRNCNFDSVYKCFRAESMELMMLEELSSEPEWYLEYTADGDGGFVLRAVLQRNTDPDRLKFRDSLDGVRDTIAEYISYLDKAFSLDSKEKCQDQ